MYGVIVARPIIATGRTFSSRPKPWVAKIIGLHPRYSFTREFVKAVYDYTYAAKSGKGQTMYWFVPPGIYEVYYPTSWKHETRYFVRVTDEGDVIEISRDEVLECLKKSDLE